MQWIIDSVKTELLKDAGPEELKRIKMPQLFISFEKLYLENKDKAPNEYLGELQKLVREVQDLNLKESLKRTIHAVSENGKLQDYDAVGQSIIDAFLEQGKRFGLRTN